MSLERYTGPWGSREIIHLLKRTMFGAKKSDLDHFKRGTLSQAVDELLNPPDFSATSLPLNDYDPVGTNVPYGKTWVTLPNVNEENEMRIESFRKWSMGVFIQQDRSIREKMLLFWHNHFATQTNSGRSDLVWLHHSMLRQGALGNFKELTKKITTDSLMLRYLNGEENTRLAPNENYARELQELFCIGKGPAAKFTETDVKEAAKILTGWKTDPVKTNSYFKADDHDTADKKFSAFYNNTLIRGRAGATAGTGELADLLNMIFNNTETALFICRKLYRWFVYYEIDDAIETRIIKPLAATLRKNNYNIKPVLSELFRSKHFYDSMNFAVQIKSPIDFCIGLQREFDVDYAPEQQFAFNYSMWGLVIDYCYKMGQIYTDPPNVSGWPAYYQAPGFYELWINTSTYPKRNEFSTTFIDYGFNRVGHFFNIDVMAFARSLTDPANPDNLIEESLELLYRIPVSDGSKKNLKKNTLLTGQSQDHYWTDAWKEYIADPENNELKNTVETRLKTLYRYIVNSAEYQLA